MNQIPPRYRKFVAEQKLKQYVKYGMDMERVMYLTGITKTELIHFAKSCGCYARLYANTYYR